MNETPRAGSAKAAPLNLILSLSTQFYNKENRAPLRNGSNNWAWNSFYRQRATIEKLLKHIQAGKAFVAGVFKNDHRATENFISSQLIVLDLDDDPANTAQLAAHPFLAAYAALIYPTASHTPEAPRHRVVFVLDEPVTHPERYRTLVEAVIRALPFAIDDASAKPAQPWLGSTRPGAVLKAAIVLPIRVVGQLCQSLAEEYALMLSGPKVARKALEGDAEARIASTIYDNALDEFITTRENRNKALNKAAYTLFGLTRFFSDSQIVRDLLEACRANGYLAAKGEKHALSTINSARKKAPALVIEVDDDPSPTSKKAAGKIPKADLIFNEQYVNQAHGLPDSGVIVVLSDKGTGKSELAADYICQARAQGKTTILAVTPLISLTRTACRRYDLESYEGLKSDQRAQAAQVGLGITLNSITSLIGDAFPSADVVVLDELSKMLNHLRSKKLFKKGKSTRVLSALEALIKRSNTVLVLDADLQQWHIDWLKSIRPDVFAAINTYSRNCGCMIVHEAPETLENALYAAIARRNGPVIAVSNTRSQIAAWEEAYRSFRVLSIHGKNSTNPEQVQFLENPDAAIDQYDAVFLSPSAATGLDIQTAISAKFGVFSSTAQTLDASGCAQLLERARNAQETHVYIQHTESGKRLTDPDRIYTRYASAAEQTLNYVNPQTGKLDFDGCDKAINLLLARVEADRNRSLNQMRDHFLAIAAKNYQIETYSDPDASTTAAKSVSEARAIVKERRRAMMLTVKPISPEEHRRKSGRGERTETDNAALDRWHLEDFYKTEINEELLDFDRDGKGREEVSLYIDVLETTPDILKAVDGDEHIDHTPAALRSHRSSRQWLYRRFIVDVFGSRTAFDPETTLDEAVIYERMTAFLGKRENSDALRRYELRSDSSTDELKIAQRMIRALGLRLVHCNRWATDEPRRYRLDLSRWEQVQELVATRLAGLAEAEPDELTAQFAPSSLQKNVGIYITPPPQPVVRRGPLNPFAAGWKSPKAQGVQA